MGVLEAPSGLGVCRDITSDDSGRDWRIPQRTEEGTLPSIRCRVGLEAPDDGCRADRQRVPAARTTPVVPALLGAFGPGATRLSSIAIEYGVVRRLSRERLPRRRYRLSMVDVIESLAEAYFRDVTSNVASPCDR